MGANTARDRNADDCSALSVESRFRRMVEGLRRDYFFYCHAPDGVFHYVSPSVRNILGYSRSEFLKNYARYLTPNPSNREVKRRTALSLKGVRQPPYEVETWHKNGTIRTLEVLEIPVKVRGRVVAVEGIARDITREKRMREALAAHDREMTAQAALILRSSGDGIIGVDSAGLATFMNDAAEKLLGWKLGELKGRPLHPAIHHSRPDGSSYPVGDCPMSAALSRGSVSRVDTEVLWRRDGSSFPASYSARPIIREGRRIGAVITFRDITAQRRLEELRGFLTHALVHDLNNPLTSIMAGAELAAECPAGRSDCASREHLAIVREAAVEMRRMISDILDMDRMESGALRTRAWPESPAGLAGAAAAAMAPAAGLEGRTIAVKAPAALPRVLADARLVRRVIENLIANALRYAPRGTVVTVSAAAGSGGREVRFSVSDLGPGIKKEHLDRVFDKYFQSDPAQPGTRKGKGLGLAFCRLAVEAHGGRIWAANRRPAGCRLSFTLPAAAPRGRGRRRSAAVRAQA